MSGAHNPNHRAFQKSNDPRDLEPPQPGAGLSSKPELDAFKARGPFVPNREALINAGPTAVSFGPSSSFRTSIEDYVTDQRGVGSTYR